jgi:hypothetical protein
MSPQREQEGRKGRGSKGLKIGSTGLYSSGPGVILKATGCCYRRSRRAQKRQSVRWRRIGVQDERPRTRSSECRLMRKAGSKGRDEPDPGRRRDAVSFSLWGPGNRWRRQTRKATDVESTDRGNEPGKVKRRGAGSSRGSKGMSWIETCTR